VQSFNGAGDTNTPTVINLCCYWLFQIPLAYSLAIPFGFGATGVFVAITISESLLAVVAVALFLWVTCNTRNFFYLSQLKSRCYKF
jgi:Na+-driven multidrug efflux pump